MSKEIGLKLKQERVNKKLTIDDVVSKLKIRKYYLEVIEEGNFGELPGLTYTVGFIRSYSKLLGIDPEPFVEKLKEGKKEKLDAPNVGLAYVKMESALPSRRTIMFSLLLLVLIYIVWIMISGEPSATKTKEVTSAPVVIDKIIIEEDKSSLPKVQEKETVVEKSEIQPIYQPQTNEEIDSISEQKNKPIEQEEVKASEVLASQLEEMVEPEMTRANSSYGATNVVNPRISVIALEDSWIQIRSEDELIFSKVLLAGDKYLISNYTDEIVLDTGNAGGIKISIDGKDLPAIGKAGTIVRDFLFTEDYIAEFLSNKNL